jgi:hypothetical protein
MSSQKNRCVKLGLNCLVLGVLLYGRGIAQTNNTAIAKSLSEASALQEVVNELQLLRRAVERSTLTQQRAVVFVERLRLQHEVLLRLSRELEVPRRSLLEIRTTRSYLEEQVKEIERVLTTATDPKHRRALEETMARFKSQIELSSQSEQRELAREAELRTQMTTEQSRMNELNERLDAMEREFEKKIEENAEPKEKKRD